MNNNLIGKKVSALVTTVENYGLFLELDNNEKAFLPKENMNISKKRKLKEIFSEGFVISAVVKGHKKDYYVVSQKEDVEKNIKPQKEQPASKKNNSKSKTLDKNNKVKAKNLAKKDNKNHNNRIKLEKKELDIVEKQFKEEQVNNEPKVKSLTDLKKLKYIGNMKISVKKTKENKKTTAVEEENKPELLKVPKNFIEDVMTTTDEAIANFKKVKKSLKEQGYLDE